MNTKQSLLLASASGLAAGAAQGAVISSGPLNLQQNWDTVNYRQGVDLTGDGLKDVMFGYDGNVQKPYVDARTTDMGNSGLVTILTKTSPSRGLPLTLGGTMIDAAYAATYPGVSSDLRGYFAGDDNFNPAGDWSTTAINEGFVGIELTLAGDTHFGWLHMIDNPTGAIPSVTLVDWAYESTPNLGLQTPVIPEPTTAALAGLGVAAFLARRLKQR